MLAKLVPDIPPGAFYEPKFDGFRAVVFRDGDDVELGSRNERPLTRYFPEIVEAVKRELPERCVVDGAGFDGVIAKPPGITYVEDRRVMFKIKHERTADCVVAGFRWHKAGDGVGSLMLGLYDEDGDLWPVGVAASFAAAERKRLTDQLAPYRLQ